MSTMLRKPNQDQYSTYRSPRQAPNLSKVQLPALPFGPARDLTSTLYTLIMILSTYKEVPAWAEL
jgi:hypothetical protein